MWDVARLQVNRVGKGWRTGVSSSARTIGFGRSCGKARRTRWQLTATTSVSPLTREWQRDVLVNESSNVFDSYNPELLEVYFKRRPWLLLQRVFQVSGAVWKVLLFKLQQRLQGPTRSRQAEQAEGQLVCQLLLELGPTFIKLGQSLSVRPDVVGEVLSQELAGLQDSCPPFDSDLAMAIIQQELGLPPSSIFSSISDQPVAAASLGQVYRATLAADGSRVAVKVQRPGMAESIALDVIALRILLGFVRTVTGIRQDIRGLADELGVALFQELDYRQEAANAQCFFEAHSLLGFVEVPTSRHELSTRRVLTMDWLEGFSPAELLGAAFQSPSQLPAVAGARLDSSAAAEQLMSLVQMGVECSLSQILETGVVHGDPHPGNLLLSPAGRLVYMDFGLLARVPPTMSEGLLAALLHLGIGQWEAMPDDLDKLGLLKPDTDRQALAADLKRELLAMLPAVPRAAADDGNLWRPLFADMTFGNFFSVIIRMAFKYRFQLPPYYLLVIRSIASLEGIALSVDPNFKIVAAAMPVVLRKLLTDRRPSATQLLQDVLLLPNGQLRLGFVAYMLQELALPPAGPSGGQPTPRQQADLDALMVLARGGRANRDAPVASSLPGSAQTSIPAAGDGAVVRGAAGDGVGVVREAVSTNGTGNPGREVAPQRLSPTSTGEQLAASSSAGQAENGHHQRSVAVASQHLSPPEEALARTREYAFAGSSPGATSTTADFRTVPQPAGRTLSQDHIVGAWEPLPPAGAPAGQPHERRPAQPMPVSDGSGPMTQPAAAAPHVSNGTYTSSHLQPTLPTSSSLPHSTDILSPDPAAFTNPPSPHPATATHDLLSEGPAATAKIPAPDLAPSTNLLAPTPAAGTNLPAQAPAAGTNPPPQLSAASDAPLVALGSQQPRAAQHQQLESLLLSAQASGLRRLLLSLDGAAVVKQLCAWRPSPDVRALHQTMAAAMAAAIAAGAAAAAAAVMRVVLAPWRAVLWVLGQGRQGGRGAVPADVMEAQPTAAPARVRAQAQRRRLLLRGLAQRLYRSGGVLAYGSLLLLLLRLLGRAVTLLAIRQRL